VVQRRFNHGGGEGSLLAGTSTLPPPNFPFPALRSPALCLPRYYPAKLPVGNVLALRTPCVSRGREMTLHAGFGAVIGDELFQYPCR